MNSNKIWKIAGIITTAVGIVVEIISGIIDEKNMEIEIRDAVRKELYGDGEEENDAE